ncbi:MAG: DedA family protein [Endomicrobiaceae bacterium]|nr:DedA family protein [Endomicrobiaceae bacterium]
MNKILAYPLTLSRKMYDWTINWAKTKYAEYALFCISFAESSFFPIPPDVLLIPMVISDKKKWFRTALICSVGSILGAMLGYYIGYALFELVGQKIVDLYNLQHVVEMLRQRYQEHAFITVFTAAFTPIPFKAITITAGLFKISIFSLFIGSAIGRSARFFIVAGLIRIFGEKIQVFIEKYFNLLTVVFVVLLVGGFFALKLLK